MTSKRLWIGMALLVLLAGAIGWRAGLEFGQRQSLSAGTAQRARAGSLSGSASVTPARILLPSPEKDILVYEPRNIDELVNAMEQTVSVAFVDTPLNSCILHLAEQYKLPFQIQTQDLEDEGIATDSPLTLKVDNVRLDSALQLLLRPLQLTWVFEDEVILITTLAKSSESLVAAVYPVGDLAADVDDFEELAMCIENLISPDSWDIVGGSGTIQWHLRTRTISIRQTWAAHTETRLYLRGLREAVEIADRSQQLLGLPQSAAETTAIQEARSKLARAVIMEYNKSQQSPK